MVTVVEPELAAPTASAGTARLPNISAFASSVVLAVRSFPTLRASALPPPWLLVVSVIVSVIPAPAVLGAERAEMIKSALGWTTVSVIAAVLVKPPDMPVIVSVTVPGVAVLLAVSVRVLVLVAGFGLKDAATPLGQPDADKLTLLLKPLCGVTVIVLAPAAPWKMLTLLGEAER